MALEPVLVRTMLASKLDHRRCPCLSSVLRSGACWSRRNQLRSWSVLSVGRVWNCSPSVSRMGLLRGDGPTEQVF